MSAARLLETARAAGLSFEVVGGDLIVEADRDPPADLLAALREHKAELLELLVPRHAEPLEPCEPVLLSDGRRWHRLRAVEIPASAPQDIVALMDNSRSRHVVLVADGHDLIVVEPWLSTLLAETLIELRGNAGGVIAALRGESRRRLNNFGRGCR